MTVFTKEGIRSLHRWTHGCLDLLVEHAGTLPFSLIVQEIPEVGLKSVRNQMVHVLFTEAAWICDLQDILIDSWAPEEFHDLESVVVAKRRVMAGTSAYLDGLSESALNAEIPSRPKTWVGTSRTPGFILHHIVTHAFHHKGQMAMMFRMLGHPIGDTDLQRSEVA